MINDSRFNKKKKLKKEEENQKVKLLIVCEVEVDSVVPIFYIYLYSRRKCRFLNK